MAIRAGGREPSGRLSRAQAGEPYPRLHCAQGEGSPTLAGARGRSVGGPRMGVGKGKERTLLGAKP